MLTEFLYKRLYQTLERVSKGKTQIAFCLGVEHLLSVTLPLIHKVFISNHDQKRKTTHFVHRRAHILLLALHTCTCVSWPVSTLPAKLIRKKGLWVQLRWKLSFRGPHRPVWLCAWNMREKTPPRCDRAWGGGGDFKADRSVCFCLASKSWVRWGIFFFFFLVGWSRFLLLFGGGE